MSIEFVWHFLRLPLSVRISVHREPYPFQWRALITTDENTCRRSLRPALTRWPAMLCARPSTVRVKIQSVGSPIVRQVGCRVELVGLLIGGGEQVDGFLNLSSHANWIWKILLTTRH